MYQNIIGWIALIGAAQYFGLGDVIEKIQAGFSDPVVMFGYAVEFVRSVINH